MTPDQVRLLVLLDINGVVLHRLRDGMEFEGSTNTIRLESSRGYPYYILPRPGCERLLQGLAELADSRNDTWGFCTTMTRSNSVQCIQALFGHFGFQVNEIWNASSKRFEECRLSYRIGNLQGMLWLFAQDSNGVCKDTDEGAVRYRNSGHRHDLPNIASLLDYITDAERLGWHGAAPDRVMVVLGTARKAKLCWQESLLVHDFNFDAASRVAVNPSDDSLAEEAKHLNRVMEIVRTASRIGSLRNLLWQHNRNFIVMKRSSLGPAALLTSFLTTCRQPLQNLLTVIAAQLS